MFYFAMRCHRRFTSRPGRRRAHSCEGPPCELPLMTRASKAIKSIQYLGSQFRMAINKQLTVFGQNKQFQFSFGCARQARLDRSEAMIRIPFTEQTRPIYAVMLQRRTIARRTRRVLEAATVDQLVCHSNSPLVAFGALRSTYSFPCSPAAVTTCNQSITKRGGSRLAYRSR